jgi:hypothetical protein
MRSNSLAQQPSHNGAALNLFRATEELAFDVASQEWQTFSAMNLFFCAMNLLFSGDHAIGKVVLVGTVMPACLCVCMTLTVRNPAYLLRASDEKAHGRRLD